MPWFLLANDGVDLSMVTVKGGVSMVQEIIII